MTIKDSSIVGTQLLRSLVVVVVVVVVVGMLGFFPFKGFLISPSKSQDNFARHRECLQI